MTAAHLNDARVRRQNRVASLGGNGSGARTRPARRGSKLFGKSTFCSQPSPTGRSAAAMNAFEPRQTDVWQRPSFSCAAAGFWQGTACGPTVQPALAADGAAIGAEACTGATTEMRNVIATSTKISRRPSIRRIRRLPLHVASARYGGHPRCSAQCDNAIDIRFGDVLPVICIIPATTGPRPRRYGS